MVKYSVENFKDLTAHLTNVAIQRQNEDFDAKADDSIWDFDRFQAYLTKHKMAPSDWVARTLRAQMRHIMSHCFLSIEQHVKVEPGQFQLLGFDLMVDDALAVHLIEINRNPDLSVHTSVLKGIIPAVLEEIVGMVMEVHSKQAGRSDLRSVWPLSTRTSAELLLPLPA